MLDRRAVAALAATAFTWVLPTVAAAETSEAEQLFQDARALVEKGSYAEACPKLERSQKLEPAVGTQFNLADCYEHVGRTATAYKLFLDVAGIARAAGKFEREKSAKERAAKLEASLAKLRVVVPTEIPGLEVQVDDATLAKAAWGSAEPVDPGTHRVHASAPGHSTFDGTVDARSGEAAQITVPALVDQRPRQVTVVTQPSSPQRTIALVVGGVGVAGLAVGGVAGVLALSHRASAEDACPKDVYRFRCPTEDGATEWNAATTAGNVSTVGFLAGGVILAGAAVLWLTAPSPKTKVGLAPTGLVVNGSF